MASAVWKHISRWFIAVIVCAACFFFVFLWVGSAPVLERGPARFLDAIHFEPMNAALDLIGVAVLSAVFAIWIVPSCYSIGFALGTRHISRIQFATVLWLSFVGLFMWLEYPTLPKPVRVVSVAVACVALVAGTILSVRRRRKNLFVFVTILVCLILLAVPFWVAFATATPDPPDATLLWSARLENEDFLGTNTSSDYGSQRQVVVIDDRVVVTYDWGSVGYEGKKPMSRYRLVSLDMRTGDVEISKTFVGSWGLGQPYLYVASDGALMLSHRRLSLESQVNQNQDGSIWDNPGNTPIDPRTLSPAGKSLTWSQTVPGGTRGPYAGSTVEWDGQYGEFAGSSEGGRRYAFELKDARGDFPEVLYEHFLIYDAARKRPIAIVRVKDLPNRRSWSAFSADGEYFVSGGPSLLNLYVLPR